MFFAEEGTLLQKDSLCLHLFSFEEALKGLLETEPPPIS